MSSAPRAVTVLTGIVGLIWGSGLVWDLFGIRTWTLPRVNPPPGMPRESVTVGMARVFGVFFIAIGMFALVQVAMSWG